VLVWLFFAPQATAVAAPLSITVHPGCFPEATARRCATVLVRGRVPASLHYQGAAQAARWRALYERWSPFVQRPGYRAMFDAGFAKVVSQAPESVAVIGLGCGTGDKELALIGRLLARSVNMAFAPVDISVPLVTAAALLARKSLPSAGIQPLVADLSNPETDLSDWLGSILPATDQRVFTFFSLLPNFEPADILPRLAGWLRPHDRLLLTANLAPGDDFNAGLARILPQYDNAETRAWLATFLEQGGVLPGDGEMTFHVETHPTEEGIRCVVARWKFARACRLQVMTGAIDFTAGDQLDLFSSSRYQHSGMVTHFRRHGLDLEASWLAPDAEEGLYLCRLASA
jgi:L-histidine Nalpha-methyltransferase